tara:strand:- start:1 stop:216 length:216 start_codon:yes stop_codon:yes gene_type:complete
MISLLTLLLLSLPVDAQQVQLPTSAEQEITGEANQVEQPLQENNDPASEESDFKPEQEISEDYPIPLPSDI